MVQLIYSLFISIKSPKYMDECPENIICEFTGDE